MHAMRMLVPPAWQSVDMIDPDLKAFYEYYATHMEPWDGPAGIVLTDAATPAAPWTATGCVRAVGHHQESAHHHCLGSGRLGLQP